MSEHTHKFRFELWEETVHCQVEGCDAQLNVGGIENALDELAALKVKEKWHEQLVEWLRIFHPKVHASYTKGIMKIHAAIKIGNGNV